MNNNSYLELKNKHKRDSFIEFNEEAHKYTITCDKESDYISVTTWIHSHFEKFNSDMIIDNMMNSKNWKNNKYYGMTKDEIKKMWNDNCQESANAGTKLHYDIECYYNNISKSMDMNMTNIDENNENIDENNGVETELKREINTSIEYYYFLNFVKDYNNLFPYRTEWRIWNDDIKLAGSIDMIFEDREKNDGSLLIYDWKRCKNITKSSFNKYSTTECISHIPDSNYWHYCLQLNIYKKILEDKYDKKISGMYLICLHPENKNSNYERIKVVDLKDEINDLFEYHKSIVS